MLLDKNMSAWKKYITAGNQCFEKHQHLATIAHYQQAIKQAHYLLGHHHDTQAAVAAFIISYHNLADLYLREGEMFLAECELDIVNSKLAKMLNKTPGDSPSKEVLLEGVNRTYLALTKHRKAYPINAQTKAIQQPNLSVSIFKNTLN